MPGQVSRACWLGVWSYSLYLWQQPFAKMDQAPALRLAGAAIVGLISFYVVEDPARRWLNARLGRT